MQKTRTKDAELTQVYIIMLGHARSVLPFAGLGGKVDRHSQAERVEREQQRFYRRGAHPFFL